MKHVIVTGANKGIGLAIVKRLLKEYPDVYVFLGSRDCFRGQAAIQEIISELGSSVIDRVKFLQLDVTSDDSVKNAVEEIKRNMGGNSSILYGLVNNAGGTSNEMTGKQVVDLNMYGVRRVTEAFLPFIEDKGTIL